MRSILRARRAASRGPHLVLVGEWLEQRLTPTFFLWLNFDGGTITQERAGEIDLPDGGPITIPKFDLTLLGFDGQEKDVMDYVLQFVREDFAAYDLRIGLTPPFPEPYTTVYIGGSSQLIGMDGLYGIASTIDSGNVNEIPDGEWDPNKWDISLVFPETWAQLGFSGTVWEFAEQLAEVVSHEAAHTFGLRHLANVPHSIMSATAPPGAFISFGIGDLVDTTEGGGTQDSALKLGQNLGWSTSVAMGYGNRLETATPIGNNANLQGILRNWTAEQWFRLTPLADMNYTLAIHTNGFANLDAVLTIFDGNGNALGSDDNSGGGRDPRLDFAATGLQTYYVRVSSASSMSSGTYLLDVASALAPATPTLEPNIMVSAPFILIPNEIDFGAVMLGSSKSLSFTLTNTGNETLNISAITLTGPYRLDRVVRDANPLDDWALSSGASAMLTVTYIPTAHDGALQNGTIVFTSNDATPPVVDLRGHGVDLIQTRSFHKTYQFTDLSGNPVKLSFRGEGSAAVVFTDSNGVGFGIVSITFSETNGKTSYVVQSQSGTQVGSIGNAPGSGIGMKQLIVQGSVASISFGTFLMAFPVQTIRVAGDLGAVTIFGDVKTLSAGAFTDAVSITGALGSLTSVGDITGAVTVTSAIGKITTASPKKATDGALKADVTAGAIKVIILEGKVDPAVTITIGGTPHTTPFAALIASRVLRPDSDGDGL